MEVTECIDSNFEVTEVDKKYQPWKCDKCGGKTYINDELLTIEPVGPKRSNGTCFGCLMVSAGGNRYCCWKCFLIDKVKGIDEKYSIYRCLYPELEDIILKNY
jgi:hypothetical protein